MSRKENDKSKAVCNDCGFVDTTFKYRSLPLLDAKKGISGLLVGVCDVCNQTVSIPSCATPRIRQAIRMSLKNREAKKV